MEKTLNKKIKEVTRMLGVVKVKSQFSPKIKNLTEHLKSNKKDHNTRRGLINL